MSDIDGVDQFLSKNYGEPWELIKHVTTTPRFNWGDGIVGVNEEIRDNIGAKLALSAFGVPSSYFTVDPPVGGYDGSGGDSSVFLPSNAIEEMKSHFPQYRIAIGYGNQLGLHMSFIDGIEKDGDTDSNDYHEQIRQQIFTNYYIGGSREPQLFGDKLIYLWIK